MVFLDFMEKGFEINIISQPVNYILVKEGDTLSLTVDVDLLERFSYQWQVRDEFTLFWKDLEDTIIDGFFTKDQKLINLIFLVQNLILIKLIIFICFID